MSFAEWVERTAHALHDLAGDPPTVGVNANAVLHVHGASTDQLRELRELPETRPIYTGGRPLGMEVRRGLGLVVVFWKDFKSDGPAEWTKSRSTVGGR